MRSVLVVVLVLWLFGESKGYGKQGMEEQGGLLVDVAERRTEPSKLILNVSDELVSNKQTRHIELMSQDRSLGVTDVGVIPSDSADQVTAYKQSFRLSLDRDAHRMLTHATKTKGHGKAASIVETSLNNGVDVAKHATVQMPLHGRNVPVSSAVKQARSRQHLYVCTSSQDRHAMRMLSDAASSEAQGNVSQLDAIAETPADEEANAVRRQGVDSALLKYAGLTLSADTQTGATNDVALPPTLAGIQAQARWLAPSTFQQSEVVFNEFSLPRGASFNPTSAFIALVYRKISSFTVYTLPPQYQFGGPVVGIMSSASNMTSLDSSLQASISLAPNTVINISLPMSSTNPISNGLCAFFASNGSIFVSSLAALPNICVYSTLGDFALVIQASSTPSPAQNSPLPPPVATVSPPTNANGLTSSSTTPKSTKSWKLVVGATCLALAGLAFLLALALISIRLADSCKLYFTTRFTGNDEALQNSLIGNNKAPSAPVMRTKPALEIDIAHFAN